MHIHGNEQRQVWIDGREISPARSQAVWNHSPDGFNWGYGGSGPAQLALAILLEAGVPQERAVRAFKWAHVAHWPAREPFVVEIDVEAWVTMSLEGDEGGRG